MQIFVLGMHRSGTSAVTRLINLMGAYVGPEEALTGANAENPKGFWERRDVRGLNDALLWSIGADWWRVADFNVERIPSEAVEQFRSAAAQIIEELNAHRPWVVKEPRLCLLFPLWRRLVECPVCVLMHRSPVQVARSLQQRNGFPLSFGIALWERYVLDALSASRGLPRLLLSYEQLMSDPGRHVDRLLEQFAALGVDGLRRPSDAEISDFLSADLYHHRETAADHPQLLDPAQSEVAEAMADGSEERLRDIAPLSRRSQNVLNLYDDVYDVIEAEEIAQGNDSRGSARHEQALRARDELFDRVLQQTEMAENAQRALTKTRIVLSRLEHEREVHNGELIELKAHSELADARVEQLSAEIATLRDVEKLCESYWDRVQELEHEVIRLSGEFEALRTQVVQQTEMAESAQRALVKTRIVLSRLEHEREVQNGELIELKAHSESADARVEELSAEIATLRDVEQLCESYRDRVRELEGEVIRLSEESEALRTKASSSEVRLRELKRWTIDLLGFIRGFQIVFQDSDSDPSWHVGPLEIRPHSRARGVRERRSALLREVSEWVQNRRADLVAFLQQGRSVDGEESPEGRLVPPGRCDAPAVSIDVIVCVHDALDEVRRCLESVISTLEGHHTLIIVDDGSGEETADYLREFAARDNRVKLIRREVAAGYTKAANCGLSASTGEFVVLLNSDTIVTSNWWAKMARALFSSPHAGIVGPLSNAASWQSVPDIIDSEGRLAVNQLPPGLTVDDMNRIAERCAENRVPAVDLINGFCFGVRREVIDAIGNFDEESFPRGYGEEIDFCFRAVEAGFNVVIATDCYVYHEKSRSYSPAARDRLAKETGESLKRKYSSARIRQAVDACKKDRTLVEIRERFRREIRDAVQRSERALDCERAIRLDMPTRTLSAFPVKNGGEKDNPTRYVLPPVNSIKPLLVPNRRKFEQLREFSGQQVDRILSAMKRLHVTVLIPVHNAYEETRQCVESVFAHTSFPFDLLIIDDCSTDPRIADLLECVSNEPSVRVITNESNLGFVETVNIGLRKTTGDVVILNSDTIVTPRWIQKLAVAAYSEPGIATVTPFSNAGGAFSVPEIGKNRELDHWLTTDAMAHIVERLSHHDYPRVPTGNGFCMYLKREAIDDIGEFDSENFGHGYGEENDYCMRASSKGWQHIIDDSTFIYHKRAASFTSAKEALIKRNREILDTIHPTYTSLVKEFVACTKLKEIRNRIREALDTCEDRREADATRILYVFHEGAGGTPATSADLIDNLPDRYESFSLTSTSKQLILRSHLKGVSTELHRFDLPQPWSAASFHEEAFQNIYFNILVGLSIELVHIRHLFKHSFDLPEVCKALGLPVVLSFHDFYFVCPSIHLLDEDGKCCEGNCPPLKELHCRIPTPLLEDLPPTRTFLPDWREQVRRVFGCCDAFVTTSEYTRNLHKKIYPELENCRFDLIEHGRDFVQDVVAHQPPDEHSSVKILLPGNIDFHKGTEFIKAIHALDQDRRLEFHFLGSIPAEMERLGINHGKYQREEIQQRMLNIHPSFVGIFSPFPETYCHTLTESWASGVPVLASNIGTIKERVESHNGGWLLDLSDPVASYKKILSIIDDPEKYDRMARGISDIDLKSTKIMADEYDRLYRSTLLNHRRTKEKLTLRSIALFTPCPGKDSYPASSFIRTLLPLSHPLISENFHTRVVETAELDPTDIETKVLARDTDIVIIQRDALPSGLIDVVSDVCRRKEIPLIFEIDDDVLSIDQSHPEFEYYREKRVLIEKLYKRADLVTVSTPAIGDSAIRTARRVEVIDNCLDENLWFINQKRPFQADRNKTLRVGYMGTFTHTSDLQIVADVLEEVQLTLERLQDIKLEFHLIGGMHDMAGAPAWYQRVYIPPQCREYPRFVRWLRNTIDWDIAVAPLADSPLNHAKSEIKYLEYAALGVPGIYSSIGAYRNVIEHGRTGLLVEHNDKHLWKKYLFELATDKGKREHIAEQARVHVTSLYLLKNRYLAWEQALTSLVPMEVATVPNEETSPR